MQIDPKMVTWDEPTKGGIDPSMVKWEEPAKPKGEISRTEKVMRGIKDPIDGGAQLLTKILPQSVVDAGNSANNWLADKTGLVAKLPERNVSSLITGQKTGVDGLIQQQEAEYQAKRASAGEAGFDGYRTLGNVLSPANVAIAAKAPAAASLSMRAAAGAGGGAASALFNPVMGEDYWAEKAKQVGVGALGGAAVPAVTGGIARIISPKASVNPQLQALRVEGVRPTIGQTLGGTANRIEEKLQSVPIIGDAIQYARQSAGQDLSRAATNRALKPIGQELPAGVTGNEAVQFTRKALGDAYDNLLPRMTVQKDVPYQQALSGLKQMVNTGAISPTAPKQFNRFLANEVEPLFQGQQAMTGETFKRLQSKVTEQINRTKASTNADERLLGDAYKELGDQLNQLSIRSNPKLGEELAKINLGYANFKRIQKAASSVAAEDGVFNPAQLHNAVKAADRSKDKARFAEGTALMQDLSAAGKNMLSNKVPNSGTVDRLLLGGGALGSGLVNPLIPAGLLGGAALYSRPIQGLLGSAVASRPALAQPAADIFRKAAPAFIPGGAQISLGLLN